MLNSDTVSYRDYLQALLIDSLVANTRYYVTFYASLADSSKYFCNDISIYFSDSSLLYNGRAKPYIVPQITNNATQNILNDKVNWMKISGNFVAQGIEKYIIIGNFKDNAHSDTVLCSPTLSSSQWTASYYYIDDVIVSPDSAYADSLFAGVNEAHVHNSLKVYPNPANTTLHIQLLNAPTGNYQINLFNSLGEEVLRKTLQSTTNIATTTLPQGLYYYRIVGKGDLVKDGKVVILH